jgi:GDP-4-dehydro-6-deoxy-D-mannose reductase
MRALITGINGFVGGHLAEHLLAAGGWDICGVGRQPTLRLPQLQGRITILVADLGDADQTATALEQARPDVVFHLAGQSNVPKSFADPLGTLMVNIGAEVNLFQALLRLHQQPLVIVATSNEIYGQICADELPIDEQVALRPVNPYAVSKATQDLLAYQFHVSHQLRTVRLRLFNHIGPRQSEQFVVSAFAAQIARIEAGLQPPLMRVGNLAAERDFTDVRDIARAYGLAAERGQVPCAYNIGSGRCVSIRALLDMLLTLSSCDIAVEPDPARMRPADVQRVVSDCRLFHGHTGWEPQIPLEHTLLDVLNYWRDQVQRMEVQ